MVTRIDIVHGSYGETIMNISDGYENLVIDRLDELRRTEETTTTHRRKHTTRTEVHPAASVQPPLPSLGIYGFLYSTHVDTGHPLSPTTIQLDTRRAILTAISTIQPPLTTQQTTELFTTAVEIIGTLNIHQQRDVLETLTVLDLSDQQVDRLLSGVEVELTREQKEGLLVSSAEMFVLVEEKRQALEYVAANVMPRLTVSQQKQFMWAISMLFPTLETVQQIIETTRTHEISQELHRRKHTTQTTITPATTARPQPLSTGIYGYLYTTHVDHHPTRPFRLDTFDTSSIHLDVRKAVLTVLSEIQPPLSPKQVSELFGATVETITELNTIQQRQTLNVLSRVTPALTDRQIQQILRGETVVPELSDEQREGLLVGSAEVFAVSREQEEALEYIAVNVQPKLSKEQQRQYVRAITLLFPTLNRVHEMIQIDRSRRFTKHTFTTPIATPQPAALGVYGFLYTTRVSSGPFTPETFDHSTIQLDIRKAVLSAISDIQPALSTNQITELFNATVEVFSELTVTQQKQILNVLSLITPELSANQMQQILTGTKVTPALLEEQRELLLIASAEILSITEEQERALEYIATNVYPQLTPGQMQQYKRAVSLLFPTLEKVMEMLKLDRVPTPFGRRTPRARSADKKHRPATPQLSRALGVYGYLYMAHVDSLSLTTNRPVSISTIDFRTIELDAKKAVLNVIDEIQPQLSVQQEDELFNAAVKLIPVLEEHQQQKLLKALFEVQPPLSPLQLHQLLGGNDISPPLSGRQQEQLLRASAGIVSMSVRDELELVHVVENVYPPLSVSQQQQFLSGINRLFPAPSKITQILQELQATAYQPKALGTFGFLYITHVKRDETAEFQSLDINLRDVDVSSIELDIEHAMLAAFADIQPPLTHKQQHQLLIASRDIFPRLTEQQQKRILNVLVQLLPPMTVRQQRQLLTGSDLVIPPLTTRQQQQLLAASSEIFTLTAKLEKQLIYATTQVSPPLSPEQQRQFLTALREIFPTSKKSQTETMIERFEQSTRGSRMSRLEEHESYGRINEKGTWERTGSEQRRDRVYRDASIFDVPDHPRRPTDYEGPHPDWVDDTRHLQVGTQERHVGHGGILKDKEVILPDERRWQAEQHMAIDEEFTDLEVSAISMNVKPRIKSQMYMDPSPPTARTFSPATGGFQYSASPQHPSPPMTEYSGFVYEAQVDGHHSPMSAEMGRYGFTYHTTLDGSELHRKAHEHSEPLHMYAESRKRSPPESVKTMSATPPWSTPPVTPTPVMGTSAGHSREHTPLLAVKELPELSKESPWKKAGSPEKLRSSMEKDIHKDKQYPEQVFRLKKDERQEVTGIVSSPQQEVYERITETTARMRHEREITESRGGSMFQEVSGRRPSDEGVFREFEKAANELEHNISGKVGAALHRPIGYEKETTVTQKTSESQRSYAETSEGRRRVTSVAVPSRTVPSYTTDEDDSRPEWVRIAEQKKSTMYAREVPVKRHLGNLPEETPLEAALERAIEKNNQRRSKTETSPLRKWDTLQLSADSLVQNEKEDSRGYKRHETETKETIEESRFHSEQAMRESTDAGSPPSLAAYASMSQSLPSLTGRRSAGSAAGYGQLKRKDLGDVVSLEELQKSSRTLKRTDGAEEETRDTSLIRRGDDVSPETKRTKRTVVRKLINGQWREVAVREEDVPVEGELLMQIEESPDKILEKFKKDDDTWSLSDAIIEETTTTRTVRRVEEEEEDVISLADSDRSALR